MNVNNILNVEEENENINKINEYEKKKIKNNENNIFCNPVHGKNGQDKQLEEIKKNNEIINEFMNDLFYYFWNFFDNIKK